MILLTKNVFFNLYKLFQVAITIPITIPQLVKEFFSNSSNQNFASNFHVAGAVQQHIDIVYWKNITKYINTDTVMDIFAKKIDL